MVSQGLPPGMEYPDCASPDTGEFWVGSAFYQSLPRCLEKLTVCYSLIGVENSIQTIRYSKYHMKILYRRQVGSQFVHPLQFPGGLALWAMPVTARVIRLFSETAEAAPVSVPAQRGSTAIFYSIKCFCLAGTQVIGFREIIATAPENVRQFDGLFFVFHGTCFLYVHGIQRGNDIRWLNIWQVQVN